MIRIVFQTLGLLVILAIIGITAMLGTAITADYKAGWCDGFAEYELEMQSWGWHTSTRSTPTAAGFQVKLDDGRIMNCGKE